MGKTSVYLPVELIGALKRLAQRRKTGEAELLRQAVARLSDEEDESPEPKLPLIRASDPSIAESIDQALEGFGRR